VDFHLVERAEAEAIYDQGREVVVEVRLRMDRQRGSVPTIVARLAARCSLAVGGDTSMTTKTGVWSRS
jgi:hypothetical protein